jgi:hypothetical protein
LAFDDLIDERAAHIANTEKDYIDSKR